MSATIYAALRLEISQYQEALARARGETEKWKQKVTQSTAGLGNSMFGSLLKADFAASGLRAGASAIESFIRRGVEFNATMDNSAVGIANVLRKFDGLNAAAAKDEAAKAMRRIIELEPQTAGSLSDLAGGFMQTLATAKSVGITTEQNVVLTSKFANALANAGLSIHQLGQEYRSILSGNITADSAIAKILGITNADVAKVKASAGDMFAFLNDKLGEFGQAGDSAGVAWSSMQSALDKAAGALAAGLFSEGIKSAKELAEWLEVNRGLFTDLGGAITATASTAATALQVIVSGAKEVGTALGAALSEMTVFEEDGTRRAATFLERWKALRDRANADAGTGAPAAGAGAESPGASTSGGGGFAPMSPEDEKTAAKESDKWFAQYRKNEEFKARLADEGLNKAQRIAALKERLAAEEAKHAELMADPFSSTAALEAEERMLKTQQELNRLTREHAEEIENVKRKMEQEIEAFSERVKAQADAKESLRQELAIAEARARGDDAAVERMEREVKIRERAKQIQEQAEVSAEKARASAERLIFLEEQAAKRKEREGKREETQETRRGHIGGVTARHYMQSGLDEFQRNQTSAIGSNSLSGRRKSSVIAHWMGGDGGPLTGRQNDNAAVADAAERTARGSRDPNTSILAQMFELWKNELAS